MAFGHVIRILILILDLQNLFLKKELQFFADEFRKYQKNGMHVSAVTSSGTGIQTPGFGYLQFRGELNLWLVEQGFYSLFCQIFAIFDDFSKWSALKVLGNFEKSSNMRKNFGEKRRKALFN